MNFDILIIDDKITDAQSVADILSELASVSTSTSDKPEKALQMIERNPKRFALVLIDFNLNMEKFDGLALAKKIWEINPQQLIAIFSGEKNLDAPIKCVGTPIVEFITKGAAASLIQKKVQNLLKKYAATHKPIYVPDVINESIEVSAELGLIAKSAIMGTFSKSAKKASASDNATILLLGESGTGKEVIARGIHNLSPRKNGPFIAINMGAFQSTLIESELFGHEKGSFTGAANSRKGAFELANGGTIFLDEIGDLPHDLQVKLLRVLQEREVQPVGSIKPIKIDVRIIAATHVNLEHRISAGKFRFDLFQRLNVISLSVPTLSERTDDIGILANHFLKKYNSTKTIAPSTLVELEKYKWPGNVRELENLIQKLIILTEDDVILPVHLPSELFESENRIQNPTNFDFTMSYDEMVAFIENIEKNYYLYHIPKSKSVRDAALNRLFVSPSTLRGRLDHFGISYTTETIVRISETKGRENEQSI